MKPWMKPLLATVVIFGTGLVTGSMLSGTLVEQRQPTAQPAQPTTTEPETPTKRSRTPRHPSAFGYVQRLNQHLKLTEEQRNQVHEAIKGNGRRLQKVLEPVRSHIQEEMKRTNDEILELLTDEQKKKFKELKLYRYRGRSPHHKGKPHPKKPQPKAEQPSERPVQSTAPRNA